MLTSMLRTRACLKPGRKGTRSLLRVYGDRLVCVRYRYDDDRDYRLKTVELIVEEGPRLRKAAPAATASRLPRPDETVSLRISASERTLRELVKGAGGRWCPERRVWSLPFGAVTGLDLEERVVWDPVGAPTAQRKPGSQP